MKVFQVTLTATIVVGAIMAVVEAVESVRRYRKVKYGG